MEIRFNEEVFNVKSNMEIYEVLSSILKEEQNYALLYDSKQPYHVKKFKSVLLLPEVMDCKTFTLINPLIIKDEEKTSNITTI